MQKLSKKNEDEKKCVFVILKQAHRFTKKDVKIFQREITLIYWLAENLNQRQAGAKAGMEYDLTRAVIGGLYLKTGCSTNAGLISYFHQHRLLYFKDLILKCKMIEGKRRWKKAA